MKTKGFREDEEEGKDGGVKMVRGKSESYDCERRSMMLQRRRRNDS